MPEERVRILGKSYRCLMWVLGANSGSLQEQQAETPRQSPETKFFLKTPLMNLTKKKLDSRALFIDNHVRLSHKVSYFVVKKIHSLLGTSILEIKY